MKPEHKIFLFVSLAILVVLAGVRFATHGNRGNGTSVAKNPISIKELLLRTPELKSKYIGENLYQCFNGWAEVTTPYVCNNYEARFADQYLNGIDSLDVPNTTHVCLGQDAHSQLLSQFGTKPGKVNFCLTFFKESGPTLGPLQLVKAIKFAWE